MTEQQTEVGVIPEGWVMVNLEGITAKIGDGIHATPNYSNNGEYYFINGNNIRDGRIIITEETKNVDISEFKRYRKDLGESTVLLSINGTIGNLALYRGEPVILGKSVAYLNIRDQIERTYLHYALQTDLVTNQFNDGITGTTINNLGLGTIRNTQIPLPPLPEQRAIAAALSDADGLIGALDALIEKKRAIKQAAMQQLLTGKTRLPGFSGEWETKRLGDISHIKTGSRNNKDKVEDGQYPFFVRSDTVERIDTYSYDCEAIIVPGEGGIGSIFHYINGRFDLHQRAYKISHFTNDICGKLVYFMMVQWFGPYAMRNTVKATVDSLRLATFQNFTFSAPTDVAEQTAIAAVLSDMDAEIAALERHREKVKQIKQGMMQQLLTGRIRLVEPPEAAA